MDAVATRIVFNGKEYSGKQDMPEAERQAFEKLTQRFADTNGDGIPDCFENTGEVEIGDCRISAALLNGKQEIALNNKVYSSREEMSADDRKLYDAAMSLLDKDGDGVPDALQKLSPEELQSAFGSNTQSIILSRSRKRSDPSVRPVMFLLKVAARCGALVALGYIAILVWENSR